LNVTAIVLAGGRALRMGGEKPLRRLRGKTLLEHATDLVSPLADEVLISTGNRELHAPPGTRAVPDAPGLAGKGPLAGILAGLEAASGEQCLLVPCDLPNMKPALLKALLEAGADCAFVELSDGPEPLVAALKREAALQAVREAVTAQRYKVVPCWDRLKPRVLEEAWAAAFGDPASMFANLNTLEDLERLDGGER
jgi:molybdenum cofactor guanylyltransferase